MPERVVINITVAARPEPAQHPEKNEPSLRGEGSNSNLLNVLRTQND